MVLHDAALALLHLRQIKRGAGHLDAVRGELFMYPVEELAGFQAVPWMGCSPH